MSKFGRNYKLVYTIPPENGDTKATVIEIKYPLTVNFDIKRNTFASANTASFKIYNLSEATRAEIFQDRYNIFRHNFVDFYAGYSDELTLIFTGKILQAYSERDGTNVITEIQALDLGTIENYSMHSFEAGTSKKDILKTLVSDFDNITLGSVGALEGNISKRLFVSDNTFLAINNLTGNNAFVDLGKLNILNNNEVIKDVVIRKITSDSGLLGTPKRRDTQVEIDMIFEPKLTVGQLVEIESSTAPVFNGQFKVVGIQHSGTISGAVSEDLKTTLNLFIGALIPNSSQIFTGVSAKQPLSEVDGSNVSPVTNNILSSINQVHKYLTNNGKPPEQQITNNISWQEALLNYTKQGSVPSLKVLSNLQATSTKLQAFLDKYYRGSKIVITSGWRSQTYNATISNASPVSSHILGLAMDFLIIGKNLNGVYTNILKYWDGRSYHGQGFIHVDISNKRGIIANDR